MKQTWTVPVDRDRERLDVFLSDHVEGLTRSQAKKLIEADTFLVNGKTVSAHHFLREGDVITQSTNLQHAEPREKRAAKNPRVASQLVQRISPSDLRILKETASWLVVYKPVNVLMHPDHDHPDGTLIDALVHRSPDMACVGEDPARPGIVSRLDKDVSGLVVVAKTQAAFDHLKRQFANHTVQKEYVALVYGEMEIDEGDIRFRIGRSKEKARMAAMPAGSTRGQAAWTHYIVIQRFLEATLLRLQILTGRTHQIRAHMLAMQHPIIGDTLYKPKSIARHIASPRLLLQSISLAFDDPDTGEKQSFEIDIDEDFQSVIASLR